jgi:hypothetical protein
MTKKANDYGSEYHNAHMRKQRYKNWSIPQVMIDKYDHDKLKIIAKVTANFNRLKIDYPDIADELFEHLKKF